MLTAELFLDALNKYRAWCDTGKDAKHHWGLYELWDEAIIKYAKAVNVSRSQACLEVFTVLDVKA
jgi:hypothetical protein